MARTTKKKTAPKKQTSRKTKFATASAAAVTSSQARNRGTGKSGRGANKGVTNLPDIIFIDAQAAEDHAIKNLTHEYRELQAQAGKRNLPSSEQIKLDLLKDLLDDNPPNYALDNTYLAVRNGLKPLLTQGVANLNSGVFGAGGDVSAMTFEDLATAAVWGQLTAQGLVAPAVLDSKGRDANGELQLPAPSSRFSRALTDAFTDFNSNRDLFLETLKVIAEAPDVNGSGRLRARDWVNVAETLNKKSVKTTAPGLPTLIRAAIDDRLSPTKEKVTATQEIILPDLAASTAQEVQRVNLEAAQAVYFAAMMDEARIFDVVDKLAELFQVGALPLERGPAGEFFYNYIRNTPDRISPYERRNTYARVFGAAVGDPNATGAQFRNFDDLWLRFVSAVSDWYRKNQVESLFASNGRYVPSQEQVRKTGLDLAANLSLYCYGGTWFVASELQKDIATYVNILSSPEVKSLYGARDMWQVIDQVSVLEFGRPVNTIRARTMADAGACIIGWLEKKSDALSQPGTVLMNASEISNPMTRTTSSAINDPTDYDLVTACEQWLAIEGVGGEIVEMKAGASPSAVTSTTPVRVPPAAQEILGAFGFSHDGEDQQRKGMNGAGRVH